MDDNVTQKHTRKKAKKERGEHKRNKKALKQRTKENRKAIARRATPSLKSKLQCAV